MTARRQLEDDARDGARVATLAALPMGAWTACSISLRIHTADMLAPLGGPGPDGAWRWNDQDIRATAQRFAARRRSAQVPGDDELNGAGDPTGAPQGSGTSPGTPPAQTTTSGRDPAATPLPRDAEDIFGGRDLLEGVAQPPVAPGRHGLRRCWLRMRRRAGAPARPRRAPPRPPPPSPRTRGHSVPRMRSASCARL